MSFESEHIAFNVLSVVSFICVFLLFLIYQRVGGNVLLRSCSVMILVMLIAVLIGSIFFENDMITNGKDYCKYQAFILNYCMISVHGLIACMMFDAWSHVSNWGPRRQKPESTGRRRTFSSSYIFCSFILPLIPTIILIVFTAEIYRDHPEDGLVQETAYYCHVSTTNSFHFLIHTAWIILYSLIGIFCSIYLLLKTISTRRKSKKSGRTTHLTLLSIIRVAFATAIYFLITFATIIPVFIDRCPTRHPQSIKLSENAKSPFQDSNLCNLDFNYKSETSYWAYLRCPRFYREFLPCMIGIGFFFMYGFGKHAKKAYIDIYRYCTNCTAILPCASKQKTITNQSLNHIYQDDQILEHHDDSQTLQTLDSASYEWDGNMRDWHDQNVSGEDIPLHLIDALALSTNWYNYYDTVEPVTDIPEPAHQEIPLPIFHNPLQFNDLPSHMRLVTGNILIPIYPRQYTDESMDSSIEYRAQFSKSCPY